MSLYHYRESLKSMIEKIDILLALIQKKSLKKDDFKESLDVLMAFAMDLREKHQDLFIHLKELKNAGIEADELQERLLSLKVSLKSLLEKD